MSTITEALIEEIKSSPEAVRREVFDFLVRLKTGEEREGREDLLPLAQSSWAVDWDTPEEDEAWRDL